MKPVDPTAGPLDPMEEADGLTSAAPIQWYPGHIAKVERELKERLTHVDVIIKVLDSRLPKTTFNERVMSTFSAHKPVLIVLNKADLADPSLTEQWKHYYRQHYPAVLVVNALSKDTRKAIIAALLRLTKPLLDKQEAKGLKRRPVRAAMIGMPNVGKSTLINMLVGHKKTRTGHRAGVTRGQQWVTIDPQVQLLDLPGLIPPQLTDAEAGWLLASVFSIGDAAFDEEEVATFLLERMAKLYPNRLAPLYDLSPTEPVTLERIAQQHGSMLRQGEVDLKRTAQGVFKALRLGRWGGITLEFPPSCEQSDATAD